ncbi:MAG: 4Fe-4S dicluster domain-containing protein [Thermincolia bacterium]
MAQLSKFIDTSKCTACRGCQTACKSWNQLPAEILEFKGNLQTHEDTSPITFTYVSMHERWEKGTMDWFFAKHQCMHCTEASCKKVCPENAISHTETGAVVLDKEKCIGCGYCAQYCPFGIPKVNEDEKKMFKCHLCSDRVSNNLKPACAKTCAPGAVQFGDRKDLVAAAKVRLAEVRKKYTAANLYGLDDQFLGGTNVFCLLLEKPAFYGLPANPAFPVMTGVWKDVIQPLGKILPLGAMGAILVSAFMNRVKENAGHDREKGGSIDG